VPTGSGFIPTAGPLATVISTGSEVGPTAKEEIQGMIDSLDKSNKTIAKYLHEYQEFASELPLEKKIELISDLVKYQEHYTKLLSSDRRADRPEVTLPPRKRLSIVHCSVYEAGESLVAAAARPIKGRRADYGFVDSVEPKIRQRRAKDIRYGIRDTWIDPRDVAEEEALTTLEGVNTRVTELAAMQEQDTHDIYKVMEDTQGRKTEIFQIVEALVDDSQ
nr:hypothetical protein [Tanacetum cinerariifolium]